MELFSKLLDQDSEPRQVPERGGGDVGPTSCGLGANKQSEVVVEFGRSKIGVEILSKL